MENSTATTTKQPVMGEGMEKKKKTMPLPNNMLNVSYTSLVDFFKRWCVMLRPFINLTDREIDVVSYFLKERVELSKNISDAGILDTMLMNNNIKKKVAEGCGITTQHFYVVMSSLRNKGIIKNGILHPNMIPNIRTDSNEPFRLLIQFNEKQEK